MHPYTIHLFYLVFKAKMEEDKGLWFAARAFAHTSCVPTFWFVSFEYNEPIVRDDLKLRISSKGYDECDVDSICALCAKEIGATGDTGGEELWFSYIPWL